MPSISPPKPAKGNCGIAHLVKANISTTRDTLLDLCFGLGRGQPEDLPYRAAVAPFGIGLPIESPCLALLKIASLSLCRVRHMSMSTY